MITIPPPDYIEFLIMRKFPELREPSLSPMAKKYGCDDDICEYEEMPPPVTDKILKEAEEYRQELESLPQKQVKELYDQEHEKHFAEIEKRRFFHEKKADADFEHWSRMPYWSLDEAIALSFGKDPEVVFLGRMKGIVPYLSPFVNSYRKLHEVGGRAVSTEELTDPVKPADFIVWAERNNVPIPARMKEILASRVPAPSKPDWEKLYKELSEKNKSNIEDLQAQADALTTALEKAESGKPLLARERASFNNIIGALLGILLGKSSSGVPYSQFNSQQSIIDAIHGNYGSKSGLSKRNLEAKFAEAQKKLKDSVIDD